MDWEKFLGVKLFAWVGGFALFLGIRALARRQPAFDAAARASDGSVRALSVYRGAALWRYRGDAAVTTAYSGGGRTWCRWRCTHRRGAPKT